MSVVLGFAAAAHAAAARPNIVLILSDDQGWGDYGFMGHPQIRTPNLDRLARESVVFPRGHVPTPLCRPSLMSIMTGLNASQHGVTGNDPAGPPASTPEGAALRARLNARIERLPTIARSLGEQGYVSFQSGKWWEGNYRSGGFTDGMTQGFPAPDGRHGDIGLTIGRKGMKPVFDFIDRANNERKPFFLWYAPYMPHAPHNPPARIREHYDRLGLDPDLAKYYAMCEWFDETCGELMDHLEKKGLRENTLVVYVCDNGWIQRTADMKVPEGWRAGFAPHSKRSVREGGVRTPILFSWRSRFIAGVRQDLVSSIDIYPTILGAAGFKPPAGLPGLDLSTNLRSGAGIGDRIIFGEGYAHNVADLDNPAESLLRLWCIENEWKLILTPSRKAPHTEDIYDRDTTGVQLYQVVQDPHETRDLASAHPDRVARLRREIERQYPQWAGLMSGDQVPGGGIHSGSPALAADSTPAAGELLYNGIRLPMAWPPDRDRSDRVAMARIPYLEATNIPKVIPIDVGRQLFVDDFLIEQTDLLRTYHAAKKYEGNPVLTSHLDGDWRHSTAGSQHGGSFYDPFEKCFKLFYTEGQGGFRGHFKVAVSQDGVTWTFPELGLYRGYFSTETGELLEAREKSDNTILLRPSGPNRAGDEESIWLDHETDDPGQRYKFLTLYRNLFSDGKVHRTGASQEGNKSGHYISTLTADYRMSSEQKKADIFWGDYSSIAYNPFRKLWIQSIRGREGGISREGGRARRYLERAEFMHSNDWVHSVYWAESDELDDAQLRLPEFDFKPELYSLNMVAYESIMLGAFQILRSSNAQASKQKTPKITEIHLGYSRDGFHIFRPGKREAFLSGTRREGTWDRGYLKVPTGICTVVGDRLYFHYTAYSGISGESRGMYSGYAMGLATLRRDGFASMDAGAGDGTLTTRPVRFRGRHLFVNVDCPEGELRVELLDASGRPIAPFTRENCIVAKVDSTIHQIGWRQAADLHALAGRAVKLRFTLTNGKLYSFWVSPNASGASYGYVAAGGPGFPRNKDTVGRAAYDAR